MAQAGLSDDDIFAGKVTDKWRNFMKNQIKRARMFFNEAEKGVTELSAASRWPVKHQYPLSNANSPVIEKMIKKFLRLWTLQVWASLLLYRRILDEIEANDYNNFTKRAYVSKTKKIASLPIAYARSFVGPSRTSPLTKA